MGNNRTAHWIFYTAIYYNKPLKYSVCSYCHRPVDDWAFSFNYCPHCGAEMTEEPVYAEEEK